MNPMQTAIHSKPCILSPRLIDYLTPTTETAASAHRNRFTAHLTAGKLLLSTYAQKPAFPLKAKAAASQKN